MPLPKKRSKQYAGGALPLPYIFRLQFIFGYGRMN